MKSGGAVSWRFIKVWRRNLWTYRRMWKVSFLTPLLEPLFFVAAFGLGLSGFVGEIVYGGKHFDYATFISPGLVATAIMNNAFFETTYASFVRMYYQKTFDGMLATPLSLEEIMIGEIVWSATKSVVAAGLMSSVLAILGFVDPWSVVTLVPTALVGGLAFGALGLWITGITPHIEMFNLPVFLLITPMFLFSGTFFPVSSLPSWAAHAAQVLPLYHLVELCRRAQIGAAESSWGISAVYLLIFSAVFIVLAVHAMKRRLIH
ncbi:ABC transporter permease [Desulfosoma caldarium]|uniref:Transport permease protein n=1 Tax=Desulfosoma caldarium TaxID=610254 RepID=A0A3N1ULF3_9BACT|nr:ABC transporter permease [Desulfosoma caldarium]ROQ90229.1 lipooligosaccharide transport system permease protein [Desulfosoma caldarium]